MENNNKEIIDYLINEKKYTNRVDKVLAIAEKHLKHDEIIDEYTVGHYKK